MLCDLLLVALAKQVGCSDRKIKQAQLQWIWSSAIFPPNPTHGFPGAQDAQGEEGAAQMRTTVRGMVWGHGTGMVLADLPA